MGLYDDVLAAQRQKEAMAAIDVPAAQSTQYGAALGMSRAKQGVNQMFGIEEPAVIQAKAAEAKQAQLNSIVSKYSTASTREDFTAAFSELMANGFPEHAAKMQEHLKNMPKPVESTADIKNFNQAVTGGYEKSFYQYQIDLKKAGGDVSQILPTPAKGFMYEQDVDGNWKSVVIPGGSADLEIKGNTEKALLAKVNAQKSGNVVLKNIGLVRKAMKNPQEFFGVEVGGTGWGSLLKTIPTTQAKGVAGMIATISGNVGFDKLQAMRDASPTGGALGQVSELELKLLMSTIGSLDQAQSQEDLSRVLNEIEYWYNHIVHGAAYAGNQTPETGTTAPVDPRDPLGVL
jgi:hypothetical protein